MADHQAETTQSKIVPAMMREWQRHRAASRKPVSPLDGTNAILRHNLTSPYRKLGTRLRLVRR